MLLAWLLMLLGLMSLWVQLATHEQAKHPRRDFMDCFMHAAQSLCWDAGKSELRPATRAAPTRPGIGKKASHGSPKQMSGVSVFSTACLSVLDRLVSLLTVTEWRRPANRCRECLRGRLVVRRASPTIGMKLRFAQARRVVMSC